ncbi:hypothetical protein J7L48_03850 [bacterium]|nr:hypothetical protein [bacterium]
MRSKIFIVMVFILALSFAYSLDMNYYIDTNETGQRFASFYLHGAFSEFTEAPNYKLRFSYTLLDKDGNILKKDRDFKEFKGTDIKKSNIKYFTSSSWANIKNGDYTIKISVVELNTHSRKKISQNFTISDSPFLDNVIIGTKGDKNLKPGKNIYYGQDFAMLTKIDNNDVLKWSFNVKNEKGDSVYEIKSSTTVEKGVVKLFSGYLNTFSFAKGNYKAIFHIEKEGKKLANTREFTIASPKFDLPIDNYKPLYFKGRTVRTAEKKRAIYYEGRLIGILNRHDYMSTYSGFVTSTFYKGSSIVGLIYSKAELDDNFSATLLTIESKLYFNKKKEIVGWKIFCYSNNNKTIFNSIDVDLANNPQFPTIINTENPILSVYRENKIEKQYEIPRSSNNIYPFVTVNIPSEGGYTFVETFLPVLYEYIQEIFKPNYYHKGKSIVILPNITNIFAMYMSPKEIMKGNSGIVLNNISENVDKTFVPLFNLNTYKRNDKLIGFEWTNGIKGHLIEE